MWEEEKIEDGLVWTRSTPGGEWQRRQMTAMDRNERDRVRAQRDDLLEALQLVVGTLDFNREDSHSAEVLRRIRAAIAKAEGRS